MCVCVRWGGGGGGGALCTTKYALEGGALQSAPVGQSAPSPSLTPPLTPLALTHKGEALNSMFVCFSMFGTSPNRCDL